MGHPYTYIRSNWRAIQRSLALWKVTCLLVAVIRCLKLKNLDPILCSCLLQVNSTAQCHKNWEISNSYHHELSPRSAEWQRQTRLGPEWKPNHTWHWVAALLKMCILRTLPHYIIELLELILAAAELHHVWTHLHSTREDYIGVAYQLKQSGKKKKRKSAPAW